MKVFVKKSINWLWHGLAYLTIAFALLVSIVRSMTPYVGEYADDIKQFIIDRTDYQLEFKYIGLSWHRLSPVLTLDDVRLIPDKSAKPLVQAGHLNIQIDVLASLFQRTLRPHAITVSQLVVPEIDLNERQGKLDDSFKANMERVISGIDHVQIEDSQFKLIDLEKQPQVVEIISANIFGRNHHYQFEAQASGPIFLGGVALIRADINGPLFNPNVWKAHAYAELTRLPLLKINQMQSVIPFDFVKGALNSKLWITWWDNQLQSAQGNVDITDVILKKADKQHNLAAFLGLHANFAYKRNDDSTWVISGDNLQINLSGKTTSPSQFNIRYEDSPLPNILVRSENIPINGLPELIVSILNKEDKYQEQLAELAITGHFRDILFQLNQDYQNVWHHRGVVKIEKLATLGNQAIPAVAGISGVLRWFDDSGVFNLQRYPITVDGRPRFRKSWRLYATSTIKWGKTNENWHVDTKDLYIKTDHGHVSGALSLLVPQQGDATIDVQAKANIPDARHALYYLPMGAYKDSLRDWLDAAIVQGNLASADITLKGPLTGFPYKYNDGLFKIAIAAEDLELHYATGWPNIEQAKADIVFENTRLDVDLFSGQLSGAQIKKTHATIPDMSDHVRGAELTVQGNVLGKLEQGQAFVFNSPLKKSVGPKIEPFDFKGPMNLDLDLWIPLEDHSRETTVSGTIHTQAADILLDGWEADFHEVTGDFHFTGDSVDATDLKASLWKMPITFSLRQKTAQDKRWMEVFGQTKLDVTELAKHYPSPLWAQVQGEAPATFVFKDYQDDTVNTLRVETELDGIALSFPRPLSLTAKQRQPFYLEIGLLGENQFDYQFGLKDTLTGKLAVATKPNSQLKRGHLVFGAAPDEVKLPEDGLEVSGQVNKLETQTWIDYFSSFAEASSEVPFFSYKAQPFNVVLDFDAAEVLEMDFPTGQLGLTWQDGRWLVDFSTAKNKGKLDIPERIDEPVLAKFMVCDIPKDDPKSAEKLRKDIKPSDFRSLDFSCKEMTYKGHQLGDVSLEINRDGERLILDTLRISGKQYQSNLRGEWVMNAQGHQSTLSGKVFFHDITALQGLIGVNLGVADSEGQLQFDIAGPWPLLNIQAKGLDGSINLNFKSGRLVDIESGFGRLLSLFSFNNIERRLRLDFSDVFKEGFSYDSLKGDVNIKSGIAQIKQMEIKGPTASIKILGRSDLVHQLLDLEVFVMPKVISSTFPVAAAVATGNPAVGAVIWAVDKIFMPEIDDVAQYKYQVTGTWKKPNIQPTR